MKLIRFNIVYIALIFSVSSAFAQVKEASWYKLDQEYYKIPVYKTSGEVFKVTYDFLKINNFPVDEVDPRELQLIHRGKEMAIEIEGEGDGIFNNSDVLYFYGKGNDGRREKDLYIDSSYQFQDYYSVYSDTTYYFLTFKNGVKGKRMGINPYRTENTVYYTSASKIDLQVFVENYTAGQEWFTYLFRNELDLGQGFLGNIVGTNGFYNFSFPNVYLNKSSNKVTLELQLVGRNNLDHSIEIKVGNTKTETFTITGFSGATSKYVSLEIDTSLIQDKSLKVSVSPKGINGEADAVSVSYSKLYYETDFNLKSTRSNYYFRPISLKNIRFTNSSLVNKIYDVSDFYALDNFEVRKVTNAESEISFLQDDAKDHEVYVFSSTECKIPKQLDKVFFKNLTQDFFDYLIVSHPYFEKEVELYRQYRDSDVGGRFKSKVVMMPEVRLHFSYGEDNPIAITRMLEYLIEQKQKPKFLFLIGNGTYAGTRNSFRNPHYRRLDFYAKDTLGKQWLDQFNYVPVMGYPASDMLFTKGLEGDEWGMAVPVGRLCVNNPKQVLNYLTKVKEFEATKFDQAWRKKLLHISGGGNSFESTYMLANMDRLKLKAEDQLFGGTVQTLTKKTNNEIEFFNVAKPLNEGVSMLTYLGHSSANISEIDIGMISDSTLGYKNKGKYPLHFFNGCHTGEAFNGGYTLMEDWLFSTPDKGTIAAFAMSSYAFPEELYQYTDQFYTLAFTDTNWFGKSLGELQTQMVKKYIEKRGNSILPHTQATQTILFGDPSIKIFNPIFPDYAFKNSDVKVQSFNNEVINAKLDSVQLILPVTNYAKGSNQKIEICIERIFNSQTEILSPILVEGVSNEKLIPITIYNVGRDVAGLNTFNISIDCENKIQEENEDNNSLSFTYSFASNGSFNLLPAPFSIEPSDSVHFVFQSYTDEENDYQFQVAKNIEFENLEIDEQLRGNVIEITKLLSTIEDTSVYFWRTKPLNADTWAVSSFSIIKQKRGWGQFHHDQYLMNLSNNLKAGLTSKELEFSDDSSFIAVSTAGGKRVNYATWASLDVNSQTIMKSGGKDNCTSNGLVVLAFDKKTLKPYHTSGMYYGTCGYLPQLALSYSGFNNVANRNALINYMKTISDSSYVLVFSVGNPSFINLLKDTAVINTFKKFGATQFEKNKDNFPYVFLGKRGAKIPVFEVIGESDTTYLEEQITLKGEKYKGELEINKITVIKSFERFDYEVILENKDQVRVDFSTVDFTNNSKVQNSFTIGKDSLMFTDSLISVVKEVSFSALFVDSTNLSVPKVNYFTITHGGMPEYGIVYKESKDTLGFDPLHKPKVNIEFVNYSDVQVSDSLVLEVKYANDSLSYYVIQELKIPYLKAFEKRAMLLELPDSLASGVTRVELLLNKQKLPEVSYNNNHKKFYYTLLPDGLNPVVSVFFDDVRIKNKEVVSTHPEIKIVVEDLFIYEGTPDTADLKIYIASICSEQDSVCNEKQLDFTKDSLAFSMSSNILTAKYNPSFSSGKYRIRVHAKDKAGNFPLEDYEIQFEVNENEGIRFEEPYPNPVFFDLTFEASLIGGGEVPYDAILQFYDIQGRLVKEYNRGDFKSYSFGDRKLKLVIDKESRFPITKGMYFYDLKFIGKTKSFKKKGRIVFFQ